MRRAESEPKKKKIATKRGQRCREAQKNRQLKQDEQSRRKERKKKQQKNNN